MKFEKNFLIISGLILAGTFLSFLPTLSNGFVYLDDDTHLFKNAAIRGLDWPHLQMIFTSTVNKIYTPLTLLSFAIEYHFFKYTPFIYHFTNLLLHCGVTVLVFYFGLGMGLPLRAAAFAGVLFGIHPMHVESVAWVTERKDVLYALFYMLALNFYIKYLPERKPAYFTASMICGLLSILSKPMALSLPLIMLLCDWFKKRPLDKSMILDKIPHLLYIIPIAWVTYSLNARVPGQDLISAVLVWVWTFSFYVQKFLWPAILVPFYTLPRPVSLSNPEYLTAFLFFSLIVFTLVLGRKNRWILFAAGYYFFSIFFILRYDSLADKNIVADRFMYLPCLGICFLFGHALDKIFQKVKDPGRDAGLGLSVGVAVLALLLMAKTFSQTRVWRASIPFWTHELRYDPLNATALGNRGEAFMDENKLPQALADFNASIAADPKYPESYNSRGQLYGMAGKLDLAEKDFKQALILNPNFAEAYNNIAIIFAQKNDMASAVKSFEKCIAINPLNTEAHNNLGDYYFGKGQIDTAFEHYQKVLAIDPNNSFAYSKRGLIFALRGQENQALRDLNNALILNPRDSEAHKNRGIIFEHKKLLRQALNEYNAAISLNPNDADAFYARGNISARNGRFELAEQDFKNALRINPEHQGALRSQRELEKMKKRKPEIK